MKWCYECSNTSTTWLILFHSQQVVRHDCSALCLLWSPTLKYFNIHPLLRGSANNYCHAVYSYSLYDILIVIVPQYRMILRTHVYALTHLFMHIHSCTYAIAHLWYSTYTLCYKGSINNYYRYTLVMYKCHISTTSMAPHYSTMFHTHVHVLEVSVYLAPSWCKTAEVHITIVMMWY